MRLYLSKFDETARLLAPECRSLLDVGCRDGRLKQYLPSGIEYTGIDLSPGPAVAKVCNIEQGIPYRDSSFDAVVALDVLEHTDNIWFSFGELVRVARRQIMVVLPNAYHWKERLRFLRSRERDKYRLTPEPIVDRHRWLVSYDSAEGFARHMARQHSLSLTTSVSIDKRPNRIRQLMAQLLPANLMSVEIFLLFHKSA